VQQKQKVRTTVRFNRTEKRSRGVSTMQARERLLVDRLDTPIGRAILVTDEEGRLRALDWEDREEQFLGLLRRRYGALVLEEAAAPPSVRAPLSRYFAGDLVALGEIAWQARGTDFQRAVWTALTTIPAGETRGYGALAAAIGKPKAVRAVGHANGANPISVVVPCHRLIGADGSLTGYGGGLARKRWLLEHEGAIAPASSAAQAAWQGVVAASAKLAKAGG
jgi:methylated-DNA-[protein]-cysteine S-methyltransferase